MIFVTVGTQQQNFSRLFFYINNLDIDEDIVVQKGNSKYRLNDGIKCIDYLSYEEMNRYLNEARIVITHGGGGTIFKALNLGKKVIVVPRICKYGEHINDHQIEFSNYLEKENYCCVVYNYEEFREAIKNISQYQFKKYILREKDFIMRMKKEIDKILGENNEEDI